VLVSFFPIGDKNRASSRYRVHCVHPEIDGFYVAKGDNWKKADALVFQRVYDTKTARAARKMGKLIVFDHSDFYFYWHKLGNKRTIKNMAEAAHVLTTSNEDDAVLMRELFKKHVYVIPGAQKPSKHRRKHQKVDIPTIVWVGRENRMRAVLDPIWPVFNRLAMFGIRFRILLINDTGSTRGLTLPFCEVVAKKWQLNTVYKEIAKCDLGICPQERQADGRFHKDENKAYTYWLCGVPCVSFARTTDWFGDLRRLLVDHGYRQQQGPRGIRRAEEVHPKNVVKRWHGIISKELNKRR